MGNGHKDGRAEGEETVIDHPYFQKGVVIWQEGKKYIKSKIYSQQKQYLEWKDKIHPSKNKDSPISHQYLYLPVKTGFDYDKQCCSNTGYAINVYPHFQTLLSDEITRRRSQKQYFKQSQLWYLFYVLAAAKADISKLSGKVGDLKPQNVFIYPEGILKVGCILSSPVEESNYRKLTDYRNVESNYLLAPEDIAFANQELIDNKENVASEIFSIGATVLSAGILDNLQEAYDFKQLKFDEDIFRGKVSAWAARSKYSLIFRSIIMNLVDLDPSKRIKFDQLWKVLSRHSVCIKAKDPFIINNPPKCFEAAIDIIKATNKSS